MNERIKELVVQAGHYVNETYKPPIRSKTPGKIWEDGHIGWNELFQEKFAELIVRECMLIGFNAVYDIMDDSKSFAVYQNIKKHFGVEK